MNKGTIKEVLPGNRHEQEGSWEAQQSNRQALAALAKSALGQPKPLSSLGETSQACTWRIYTQYTSYILTICAAWDRSVTVTMENPGYPLWPYHIETNVVGINSCRQHRLGKMCFTD